MIETLNNLGTALREMRRVDEAITAHEEAAPFFRETEGRHGDAMALNVDLRERPSAPPVRLVRIEVIASHA